MLLLYEWRQSAWKSPLWRNTDDGRERGVSVWQSLVTHQAAPDARSPIPDNHHHHHNTIKHTLQMLDIHHSWFCIYLLAITIPILFIKSLLVGSFWHWKNIPINEKKTSVHLSFNLFGILFVSSCRTCFGSRLLLASVCRYCYWAGQPPCLRN